MGNAARCRLCEYVLYPMDDEIFTCKCGEVTLDGIIKKVKCQKSVRNYIEIDDKGNEIVDDKDVKIEAEKPDKESQLNMLDEMIKSFENLPPYAMQGPINHYDFTSALLLLSSILRES